MTRKLIIFSGVLILLAAGIAFYPQIMEGTNNPCGAFQVYGARIVADKENQSPDDLVQVIASVKDGARSYALVKHKFPNLPPTVGCIAIYYQVAFGPKDN